MNNYRSKLTQFLYPYKPYYKGAQHLVSPFEYTWRPKKFRRIEKLLYFHEWATQLYKQTLKPEYRDMMTATSKKLYRLGVSFSLVFLFSFMV